MKKKFLLRSFFATCFAMMTFVNANGQDWKLLDHGNCVLEGSGAAQWAIWEHDSNLRRLMLKGDGELHNYSNPFEYGWNQSQYNPFEEDYWTGIHEFEVSEGIYNVPEGACWYYRNLRMAILPEGLRRIGNSAFYGSPLYDLNRMPFTRGTEVLENMLPPGLEDIGHYAFGECSFTSVILPNSVKSIGECAFAWNSSLTDITCYASIPPTAGQNMFDDCTALTAIYVPDDAVGDYKAAEGWSDYASLIKPISEYTGIVNINATQEKPQTRYDLSGRIVTDDYKGIVIVNGRKVVVK